jgi:ribosomal protein S18 acetylase RimI-like enzyme
MQIYPVSKSDSRVTNTLKDAFIEDTMMRWLWPDRNEFLIHFGEFIKSFSGNSFIHSTAYVAGNYDGVAMWSPPNVQYDKKALCRMLQDTVHDQNIDHVFSMIDQMGKFHPRTPHWYLSLLGVIPSQRSKGIGAALLRHILTKCDSEHILAYLEATNQRNVKLYQIHGFEIIGTIQAGDLTLFPMIRKYTTQ